MTVDGDVAERVRRQLVLTGQPPTAVAVAAALRAEAPLLDDQALLQVAAAVQSDLVGAGPLEPLLRDAEVSDVLVNGPDEVWIDRGDGLERATARFSGEEAVRQLAARLAASAGRRLDAAQPAVDARLPGGVRLHAVLPPISPSGTVISLRVARQRAFSVGELESRGCLAPEIVPVLQEIVRSKVSFLVTGGTGSGKTTLLSALLGLAAPGERLVLVEDSGELRPSHPHVVRLEARQANVEGAGAVELHDLIRQAMRMRPDRLVVGEVRGREVVDLLAALNTGHDGGCGTVHANSPEALPSRLEALALAGGLGREALHSQLAAAVQVVIHLSRGDGLRRVAAISVLARDSAGVVAAQPALTVACDGDVRDGPGASSLAALIRSATPRTPLSERGAGGGWHASATSIDTLPDGRVRC